MVRASNLHSVRRAIPAQVGVTHYFSIEKARKRLGYMPVVLPDDGTRRLVQYWQERQTAMFEVVSWVWYACIWC